MVLDPLDALGEPGQLDPMADHCAVILLNAETYVAEAGRQIIRLTAVPINRCDQLVQLFGLTIEPSLDALEARAGTAHRLRHFGQQLVDRCQVDAVAALHCGKKVTPNRLSGNSANSTCRSLR